MPKPGGLYALATALPSLLVQLHHTASHGTKMNESLCCLESTEVTEEPCLWVSAKLGTEPGTEPQARTGSSRGRCPGGAPFCPHSHSAQFLFKTRQKWEGGTCGGPGRGGGGVAGGGGRRRGQEAGSISSSFPFEILAAEPGGPKYMARSTSCPIQHFAVFGGFKAHGTESYVPSAMS